MGKREELIDRLIEAGYLKSMPVIQAMRSVRRDAFLPPELERHAYEDTPLPIGYEQTISAPHMVALMCESALLARGQKVLEIGAGSGYHACVISRITGSTVYTVERLDKLAEQARRNLKRAGCDKVVVIVGDGTLGYEERAPYDRIIVAAAAPNVPPPLIEQLKDGGKLLIPVGTRSYQTLLRITKHRSRVVEEDLGGCVFVPLIGRHGWDEGGLR